MYHEFLMHYLKLMSIVNKHLDSPHYAVIVRRYLDEVFPNRWIGRRGQDLRILLPSNFFMGIPQE
jgi:hypothetical protein